LLSFIHELNLRNSPLLAFIEGYDNPTVAHVKRAGMLISYYLESMVIRTMDAQHDVNELLAHDLLDWIKAKSGSKLSADQFKALPPNLRAARTARHLLQILVDTGHMRVTEKNRKTGKATMWEINQ
jgi:hypothetical protein